MQDPKKTFTEIFKKLDEKELKGFINKYCKNNREIQNKFLTHFAHKIEVKPEEKYQMIIDNSIKSCMTSRGYFPINPKKTSAALKPLHQLLKKEKSSCHQKPYEPFLFARLILQSYGELYELFYEVEEGYKIEDLFFEAIVLIREIAEAATVPHEFKEEMFEELLDLSQRRCFSRSASYEDGGVDLELLKIAATLCDTENIDRLLKVLDKKIAQKNEYYADNFIKLKIEVLQEKKLADALRKTIAEYMDRDTVRRMVIDAAIKNGEIDRAIDVIQEGIVLATQKHYPGIVTRYEEELLKIYRDHGREKEYLALISKMFWEDSSMKYYDRLKECYSEKAWHTEREKIIREIKGKTEASPYRSHLWTLAEIYAKEKMEDALFDLIKKNSFFDFLDRFGKHCQESYSSEILRIYGKLIDERLRHIKTRKEYAAMARLLKELALTYKGGKAFIANIYRDIKRKNPKKPALLEEMSILDFLENQSGKHNKKRI